MPITVSKYATLIHFCCRLVQVSQRGPHHQAQVMCANHICHHQIQNSIQVVNTVCCEMLLSPGWTLFLVYVISNQDIGQYNKALLLEVLFIQGLSHAVSLSGWQRQTPHGYLGPGDQRCAVNPTRTCGPRARTAPAPALARAVSWTQTRVAPATGIDATLPFIID